MYFLDVDDPDELLDRVLEAGRRGGMSIDAIFWIRRASCGE
jgi:hypothetical protein